MNNENKTDKKAEIDQMTKEEYAVNLQTNISGLMERLKNKTYSLQPLKRVYIPKVGGTRRALGIPTYEDKIVQMALSKILQAIYEQEFLEISYGFMSNKSSHDALKKVNKEIAENRVNYGE